MLALFIVADNVVGVALPYDPLYLKKLLFSEADLVLSGGSSQDVRHERKR